MSEQAEVIADDDVSNFDATAEVAEHRNKGPSQACGQGTHFRAMIGQ